MRTQPSTCIDILGYSQDCICVESKTGADCNTVQRYSHLSIGPRPHSGAHGPPQMPLAGTKRHSAAARGLSPLLLGAPAQFLNFYGGYRLMMLTWGLDAC